ncbi:hypothetical protein HYQ44_001371 [Verticillium longisporum]|nr:hypothetical protein HYQ44_001371 [Verticillium longisporum]
MVSLRRVSHPVRRGQSKRLASGTTGELSDPKTLEGKRRAFLLHRGEGDCMRSQYRMRPFPCSPTEGLQLSFFLRSDSSRQFRGCSKAMAEFSREAPELEVGLLASHVNTPVPTVSSRLQPGFERVIIPWVTA